MDEAGNADERLRRIEEHAGFMERTIEQLSGEIAEINRRVQAMGRRMEGLEARVGKLMEGSTGRPGGDGESDEQ